MLNLQEILLRSDYINQRNYWLNKLKNIKPTFLFAKENKNCDEDLHSIKLKIPLECSKALREFSDNNELSLYIILITVLKALISKFQDSSDISVLTKVNTNVSDKNTLNNIVLLRSIIENRKISFKELLFDVNDTIISAFQNQNFPFDRIFSIKTSDNKVLNYSNIVILYDEINNVSNINIFKNKISILITNNNDIFSIETRFNKLLYNISEIERLSILYIHAVNFFVFNKEALISEYTAILENDLDFLINKFNNTLIEIPYKLTVIKLFEDQTNKNPNKTALVFNNTKLSYKELSLKSNQVAIYLSELGFKKGEIAAIISDNSIDLFIWILGILKAGGAYLPIDPHQPIKRLQYILNDSNINFLFIQSTYNHFNISNRIKHKINENTFLNENINKHPKIEKKAEKKEINYSEQSKPAYIIYTSGSTGNPKGVIINHYSLLNYIEWAKNYYMIDENFEFPFFSNFSFDMSITSIFVPLVSGCTVTIFSNTEKDKGIQLERIFLENKFGIIKITPSQLEIIRYKKEKLKTELTKYKQLNLKSIIIGGEYFSRSLANDIYSLFNGKVDLFNEYGPTEATVGCIIHKYNPDSDKNLSVPIGIPINNCQVYLLNENMQLCPLGTKGEIYIAGNCIADGYLNNVENTHYFFNSNTYNGRKLYKTRDIGYFTNNNILEYVGRNDNQIKIRGYRIELGEIENAIKSIENIENVYVYAKETNKNKFLYAYYTSSFRMDEFAIRKQISNILPEYMIPNYIIHLPEIPLTKNGKIDISKLQLNNFKEFEKFIIPTNDIENILYDIWLNILKINKGEIDVNSNFFYKGGNSLNATIMVSEISNKFGIDFSMIDLFDNPTIKQQAQQISKSSGGKFRQLQLSEKKEYYPLSGAQVRIYFQQLKTTNKLLFNIQSSFLIEGDLKTYKLQQVFNTLVERHEILRTSIMSFDYKLFQRIHPPYNVEIEIFDNCDVDEALNKFIRPFNIESYKLFRVALIEKKDAKHLCVIDMHHIIIDALSQKIIVEEMKSLLNGLQLENLTFQYKDYCEWLSHYKKSTEYLIQESYWKKKIKGNILNLNLFKWNKKNTLISAKGEMLNFNLSSNLTERIRNYCKEFNITPYIYLLSGFYLLLNKYTGKKDLVVGCPLSGRRFYGLEKIVGFFINMLPIYQEIEITWTFKELLSQVKKTVLDTIENQNYQSEDLISNLKNERNIGEMNPLFNIVFEMYDDNSDEWESFNSEDNINITPYFIKTTSSRFELIISIRDNNKAYDVFVEYSLSHYNQQWVEKFITDFKDILKTIVENPSLNVIDIGLKQNCVSVKTNEFDTEDDFEL